MKYDGGPAFPSQKDAPRKGMSLRDYLAGQALVGLLACPKVVESPAGTSVSKNAYAYADAMLAEREKFYSQS